jgi:hypothetical protein
MRLLTLFRPKQAQLIFLAQPPQRAGANYVANMLRSWEFRTKHLPALQRRNAVGIVDCDAEGDSASLRFDKDGVSWRYASLIKLQVPAHLRPAWELGMTIPVAIEELWPAEVWTYADQRGWLVQRSKKGLVSEKLLERLAEKDERLSDLIDDSWRPFFEKRVNDDHASTAKVEWANYIASLSEAQLRLISANHLELLDLALGKLGI